ncbi:MAG: transporter [Planctomycetota bacterium]|jgi:hypothetical protein
MKIVPGKGSKSFLVFLVGYVLVSSSCFAAELPELVTDRPDQTESSTTVPYESIQIETGWTHSEKNDDDIETDVFPETLLRYGIAEKLELRFIYVGYVWERTVSDQAGAQDSEGSGDIAAGFKLKLWDEEDWLPEAAIMSHVSIPAGKAPFSSERFDPDYRLAFSHTLSDRISLAYNLGQIWISEEDADGDLDTKSDFQYTAALGIGLNEKLGGFVEFFGDIPTGGSEGPANYFDGGFTYLAANNLQLDVSSGIGLSDSADDWFLSAGLSIRFR